MGVPRTSCRAGVADVGIPTPTDSLRSRAGKEPVGVSGCRLKNLTPCPITPVARANGWLQPPPRVRQGSRTRNAQGGHSHGIVLSRHQRCSKQCAGQPLRDQRRVEEALTRVSSGFRINYSGDDAAGLAVANRYRSDVAIINQGMRNANDGLSTLQIKDGALDNISKLLDRMATLATQAASASFTGSLTTLNNEFQDVIVRDHARGERGRPVGRWRVLGVRQLGGDRSRRRRCRHHLGRHLDRPRCDRRPHLRGAPRRRSPR
jgi:hypothetical protein